MKILILKFSDVQGNHWGNERTKNGVILQTSPSISQQIFNTVKDNGKIYLCKKVGHWIFYGPMKINEEVLQNQGFYKFTFTQPNEIQPNFLNPNQAKKAWIKITNERLICQGVLINNNNVSSIAYDYDKKVDINTHGKFKIISGESANKHTPLAEKRITSEKVNDFFYFAYDSTMNEELMLNICPHAEKLQTVCLPGYEFIINERGLPTIISNYNNFKVEGVIWKIPGAEVAKIVAYENQLYPDIKMGTIQTGNRTSLEIKYFPKPESKRGITPQPGTLQEIVDAAKNAGLSNTYIEMLKEVGFKKVA